MRPAELAATLRDDTALATVMYANNEIGTIQPVAETRAQSAARTASPSTPTRCRRPDMCRIDVARESIDLLSAFGA